MKFMMKNKIFYFIILTLMLLKCPDASSQTNVKFCLQWSAQSQFAGYYAAINNGYYEAEGLNIEIKYPSSSKNTRSVIKKNETNFISLNLGQALALKQSNVNLINIMQTSHSNSLCIVSRYRFHGLSSLQSKDIGYSNGFNNETLRLIVKKFKLHANWIMYNGGVNLFLSGAVDYCLMRSYNELLQLEECGVKIPQSNIIRLKDVGYDVPEDGIYVTKEYYDANKSVVTKFVRASIKGWLWVKNNKGKALEMVMRETKKNHIGTNRFHQMRMLNEILLLQRYTINNPNQFRLSKTEFDKTIHAFFPANSFILNLRYNDFVK